MCITLTLSTDFSTRLRLVEKVGFLAKYHSAHWLHKYLASDRSLSLTMSIWIMVALAVKLIVCKLRKSRWLAGSHYSEWDLSTWKRRTAGIVFGGKVLHLFTISMTSLDQSQGYLYLRFEFQISITLLWTDTSMYLCFSDYCGFPSDVYFWMLQGHQKMLWVQTIYLQHIINGNNLHLKNVT